MHTHALARTHTYFTQCQIKITQGNFQGCIHNHHDKNSIFEVAEVEEQTTAQAKKRALALAPSPLLGDVMVCAGACVEEARVPRGMKPSGTGDLKNPSPEKLLLGDQMHNRGTTA